MPRIPLPLHTTTGGGVELAFFIDAADYRDLDPQTWPTTAGIRAPAEFDAVAWHEDGLIVEYVIRKDPGRDAFQVYGVRIDRAVEEDHAPLPITGEDAKRVGVDDVLREALAFFERVSRFDRLAVVPSSAAHAPAPQSRAALRKRKSATHDALELVAQAYNSNLEGAPALAAKAALEEARGREVSRSTVDRLIRDARDAKRITATAVRGRKPKP